MTVDLSKLEVEVVRWVNVYEDGPHAWASYETKASADDAASADRIACVELRGSYEVEEEVEE